MLVSSITSITDHINTLKSLPTYKDLPTPPEPTTVVPTNRRSLPLDGVQSMKICGMWNLKYEISSQIFYKLLFKTKLTEFTDLDLNKFYNHTKMCLNAVTRLR